MLDGRVVSACLQSREAYEVAAEHLDEDELSPQGQMWFPLIRDWYETDPTASRVDSKLLIERAERKLPQEHMDTLVGWFDKLEPVDSPMNIAKYMIELKQYLVGNELCAAIQGRKSTVPELTERYHELLTVDEFFVADDGAEITAESAFEVVSPDKLIKLAPKKLNERIGGGLIPGNNVLVYARPESGKTLFAINALCGFVRYGHRVLYVGNEEPGEMTMRRVLSNLSHTEIGAINDNKDVVLQAAAEKGIGHLILRHEEETRMDRLEGLIKKYEPKVVILDQVRNISVPGKDDSLLRKITYGCEKMRSFAARHNLVSISLSQAGPSDNIWLSQNDLADNKTGGPGAIDLMIGIGVNDEMMRNNTRAISLAKNKINGNHEGFVVQIDPLRSKLK